MAAQKTPTDKVKALFTAHKNQFVNLYTRWQDEKEHEDFADYKEAVRKTLTQAGMKLVKMTKRPFAIEFTCDGRSFGIQVTASGIGLYERSVQ